MTQVPGSWHADPTGRFEYRYWDGTQWTEHVSRAGQVSVDPLTAPSAPQVAAAETVPDDGAAPGPATTAPGSASPWAGASAAPTGAAPPSVPTAPTPPAAGVFNAPAPPPGGPGGYAYQPYMAAPAQVTVAGLAVASMVLGILWIYWIGSILAIIFGHIAISQIKKSNGWKSGKGMAIAGLVLGYLGLASLIFVIIFAVATANSRDGINSDRSDGYCNQSRFLQDPDC